MINMLLFATLIMWVRSYKMIGDKLFENLYKEKMTIIFIYKYIIGILTPVHAWYTACREFAQGYLLNLMMTACDAQQGCLQQDGACLHTTNLYSSDLEN